MNVIRVAKRGADRIRGGHLWIYRSDVIDVDAEGGSVVSVQDEKENFVGQAFYSDASQIALRFLTKTDETIDSSWWRKQIVLAASRRVISEDTNAYRLIYSEGHLLPSLIVDRYADVLVMQTLSQGSDSLKPLFTEILRQEFAPRAIIERSDVRVRLLEGLPLFAGTIFGAAPDQIEIRQHGIRFLVAPGAGQRTGLFLDQAENRIRARAMARGRALDCFTFNGAFAIHLAGVCESVIGLDVSSEALNIARQNAGLNGLTNVDFRELNVFDALREFETGGERFDTIVLDPPAFAKNRASLNAAMRGYKEINLRALKLLNPGGVLITCTCSYHVSEHDFLDASPTPHLMLRRHVQLVERRIQSTIYPVLTGVP